MLLIKIYNSMELEKFKKMVLEVLTELSKDYSIPLKNRKMINLCLESFRKSMDDKDFDYVEDVCEENGDIYAERWAIGYVKGFTEGFTNEIKKHVLRLRSIGESDEEISSLLDLDIEDVKSLAEWSFSQDRLEDDISVTDSAERSEV